MKKVTLLFLAMLWLSCGFSQNEDIRWVIGIENGMIYSRLKNPVARHLNYSYGVNLERPTRKFSYGLGLLHTSYGRKDISGFAPLPSDSGEPTNQYLYQSKTVRHNYLTLSPRLQYRLPCNCVYLHVAYNVDFLAWSNEEIHRERTFDLESPPEDEGEIEMKSVNTGLEFGIGFKMHFNEQFRLFLRPTYGITRLPTRKPNRYYKGNSQYLRMAFGLQWGIK